MDFVWLAVSVTLLAGENRDGTPDLVVVPHKYYESAEECDEWRKDRYANPWGSIDPASGKPSLGYYFDCTPQTRGDLLEQMQEVAEMKP